MRKEIYAKQCSGCGAVTVEYVNDEGQKVSNSMPLNLFEEHFKGVKLEKEKYSSCNYCVNHWGIDLCGCGSGNKVGECNGEFCECRNDIPAQHLDIPKTYSLWN
jgi:hypothetical protein